MRSFAWLLAVVGVLGTHTLSAQTVVRPTPPLDPARVALRNAVLVLRDTLVTIDGAAARLQRDYRSASSFLLLSRARIMRDACARSVQTIPPTQEALLAAQLSDPKKLKRRNDLVSALDRLKGVLSRCQSEFAAMSRPDQAETVRGYANDRAVRVQGALRQYEQTLRDFLGLMEIPVSPLGAEPPPMAG